MYMNVFSVRVRIDGFDEMTEMYRHTIDTFITNIDGFRGMLGLIDRDTGDVLSIALNDRKSTVYSARESSVNREEIQRYEHLFITPPERELFRVEIRYMPMNRPFPGDAVVFARTTTGWVRPRDVGRTISLNRDSVVYAAIGTEGCCGFLLCADHESGKIFGVSLWDSLENLQRSESDRGYYHQEMAKNNELLLGPPVHRKYEMFARKTGT